MQYNCTPNTLEMLNKTSLRNFIGELPLAAELDYALRHAGRNRVRKDHYTDQSQSLSDTTLGLPKIVR